MDNRLTVTTYLTDRAKGVSAIVKLNGVPHLTRRAFDPNTGVPVPSLVPLERAGLVAALADAQAQVEIFTAMLADFDSAPEKLAP